MHDRIAVPLRKLPRPGRWIGNWNSPVGLAALCGLLAAFSLLIDMPVARWATSNLVPGDLHKLLMLAEVFAHGGGVLMILLTVAVLDPLQRRRLPRIAVCCFGAGLAVNLVKLCVARSRPHSFDLSNRVWDSFAGYFPLLTGSTQPYDSVVQSFPSGHAATAVGLALGLTWLYPRGRWLFCLFAVLACLQRVVAGAHYPSDTLAGAAVALLIGGLVLRRQAFGRRYALWEEGAEDRYDVLVSEAA